MSKPKLRDFKKYINNLDEKELREELLKLFRKLPQVQEYYIQELMSESEREAMLVDYKKKISNQFWTRSGNPQNPSNAELRRLLSAFEKVSVFPIELIDLLLHRVETATEWANSFGGMSDADYNASIRTFGKAAKMMAEHHLEDHFRDRCQDLFQYHHIDYWYREELENLFERYVRGK